MRNYTVVNADFVTKINTKQTDGSLIASSKSCGRAFVEVVKHTTDKSLEGSSMRTSKGIIVLAYTSIYDLLNVSTAMVIGNTVYGNLEVAEIVGNKQRVQITGYA